MSIVDASVGEYIADGVRRSCLRQGIWIGIVRDWSAKGPLLAGHTRAVIARGATAHPHSLEPGSLASSGCSSWRKKMQNH